MLGRNDIDAVNAVCWEITAFVDWATGYPQELLSAAFHVIYADVWKQICTVTRLWTTQADLT